MTRIQRILYGWLEKNHNSEESRFWQLLLPGLLGAANVHASWIEDTLSAVLFFFLRLKAQSSTEHWQSIVKSDICNHYDFKLF